MAEQLKTAEEYFEDLESNLEELNQSLRTTKDTDELLKLLAKNQILQSYILKESLKFSLPKQVAHLINLPPYSVINIPLDDTYTSEEPYELEMPGDTITAATDGSLAGIEMALDTPINGWIPLDYFNPYKYWATFQKIYLTWAAQSGKTLYLHIGRDAGAETNPQIISTIVSASPSFCYNQVSVGTTAVQLRSTSFLCHFGALIKADNDNASDVYIGDEYVTTSNGLRLAAGEGMTIEIDNVSRLYAVASAASQKVLYVGV